MTDSSTLETKLRGRQGSTAPAAAAAKVLGVEPRGDAEKARFEVAPPLKETIMAVVARCADRLTSANRG